LALLVFAVWLIAPGPSNVGIGFFYAIPVALATWWFGGRAGAVAVLACGVLYCAGALIQPVDEFVLTLAVRMLALSVVAVVAALLRERHLVLEHSVEELEAIRAALTPGALPQLPGVDARRLSSPPSTASPAISTCSPTVVTAPRSRSSATSSATVPRRHSWPPSFAHALRRLPPTPATRPSC
jgi:hypothetical protein